MVGMLPLFVNEEGDCGGAFEGVERSEGERLRIGSGKVEIGNEVTVQINLRKMVRKVKGEDELRGVDDRCLCI